MKKYLFIALLLGGGGDAEQQTLESIMKMIKEISASSEDAFTSSQESQESQQSSQEGQKSYYLLQFISIILG